MARKKIARAAPPRRRATTAEHARLSRGLVGITIALIALNLVVYSSVRHFDFVNWDDPSYITENANVQEGLTWHSAKWALLTGYSPYWHPMTWLSHLLDVRLFGLDAGGHHVTSLLIHIANTLLLFGVLQRMTHATSRSAFVAALFAVHPLHVESVAWVAERKDVLSTFFWALTIWAYIAYVRRPRWQQYALLVATFGLALMSKPMVVTLPFVLLLLDVWPLRRITLDGDQHAAWKIAVLDKLPLLALAIATSVATVVVQHRVGAMAGLDALPWHLRAANGTVGYVAYLWKTIWPTHLAAFYPYRVYPMWVVTGAALFLIGVTLGVIVWRNRPYLFVGWLWYLITLAPVIGLLQAGEQRMADRFMYVPMIGILLIVAWAVPDLVDRWRLRRAAVPVSAVAIVLSCTLAAHAQVRHWSDSITLWRHAARVTPDSYIAYENLGQALRERGQFDEAQASYQRALALAPAGSPAYRAVIHNSLGMVMTRQGRTVEARDHFAAAVRLNPGFAEPHCNLGNALAAEGRFGEAVEHYRAAVRIKPDFTEAQVGLGSAFLSQRNAADAIVHYQEALRVDPKLAQAHNGLGAALALQGKDDEAMAQYSEALRLKPDLPTAHLNVAVLLIKRGKLVDAQRHLRTALTIDPEYHPASQLLARIADR